MQHGQLPLQSVQSVEQSRVSADTSSSAGHHPRSARNPHIHSHAPPGQRARPACASHGRDARNAPPRRASDQRQGARAAREALQGASVRPRKGRRSSSAGTSGEPAARRARTHARAREGRGEGEGQLAGRSAKGAQRAVWRTHARTRARGRNQGLVQCRAAPLPATTPCTARPSRHAPRAQADARPCPAVRVWRALPPKSGRALSAKELLGEDDAPKQKPDESFMVRPARPACALARARRAAPRPINQPRVRRRERG